MSKLNGDYEMCIFGLLACASVLLGHIEYLVFGLRVKTERAIPSDKQTMGMGMGNRLLKSIHEASKLVVWIGTCANRALVISELVNEPSC